MTSVNSGGSLAKILKSQGPIVSCVLLRHEIAGDSSKKEAEETKKLEEASLDHLIEEIKVDTTPNQNGVQSILGGPFTFVGQYPSEGVVVMGRSDQQLDLDANRLMSGKFSELKLIGEQLIADFDPTKFKTKEELVQALCETQLPVNPHALQPPLHRCKVRGNILIMRVGGGNDEEEDEEEEEEEMDVAMAISKAMADLKQASAVSNDDFFLDYTKEEYLAFAARTDIVAEEPEESSVEEEDVDYDEEDDDENEDGKGEKEEDEDDDDEDEEFNPMEAGTLQTKEEKNAVMQLIMSEVLTEFREINKRGPNSEELLDLRQQVAAKLGLELPEPPAPGSPTKRAAPLDSNGNSKRVKFDTASANDEEDAKPKAKNDEACKENDGMPTSPAKAAEMKPAAK